MRLSLLIFVSALHILSCTKQQSWTAAEADDIAKRMRNYVYTPMVFDASDFTGSEKKVLKALIKGAEMADEIFWSQTYPGNMELRKSIRKTRSADDPVRLFFEMQAGPFDRLVHNDIFMDAPARPVTAGFYPPDMSGDEFNEWVQNYLLEHGSIEYNAETKRFNINFEKIDDGITRLAKELLLIEAEGDYERAKKLELQYAGTPDFVQSALDNLDDLPIDVVPQYKIKWN